MNILSITAGAAGIAGKKKKPAALAAGFGGGF